MPPPSQSASANGLVGFANTNAQISVPEAAAAEQSSLGSLGSPPLAHSVALSTPPPSQSAVATALNGLAVM